MIESHILHTNQDELCTFFCVAEIFIIYVFILENICPVNIFVYHSDSL